LPWIKIEGKTMDWKKPFTLLAQGIGKLGSWVKTIPSEPNGTGSSSRIALLVSVGSAWWLLYAYYHYHGTFPTADVFYGLAALVSAAAGAYGINKWMKGGGDGPQA